MTPRTTKKSLPILNSLDDVRVASPCHAEWDAMRPVTANDGERARFCGDCEKNVYDLSAMTRVDAMALIERHEGRCCVRFYQRPDGTVLTEDCPVGLRAALKRAERRALGGIAAGIGAAAAFVAFLIGGANPVSRKLVEIKEVLVIPEAPPPPMMGAMPPPDMPMMGDIAPPQPTMGEMAVPPEPTPPPRQHVKMGKIAAPRVAPEPPVSMGIPSARAGEWQVD